MNSEAGIKGLQLLVDMTKEGTLSYDAGTEDEARMGVYASFLPHLGDYYNVTPAWTEQRTVF